jgi:hypothetical protein
MCNTSNKTMMPTRRKRRSQLKPLCVLAVPQLANKAYSSMREDPQAIFRAKVKPGRNPGSFELMEIE